jgi:hypothetical protein
MMQRGLLIMSTEELDRLTIVQKIVDKRLTQVIVAHQLGLTVRQVKRLAHNRGRSCRATRGREQWGRNPISRANSCFAKY